MAECDVAPDSETDHIPRPRCDGSHVGFNRDGCPSTEDLQQLHRRLMADMHRTMHDGHRQLQREWTDRLQQLQRQQLDFCLRSVEQLLEQHAGSCKAAPDAERMQPRGQMPADGPVETVQVGPRHVLWHHDGKAPSCAPLRNSSSSLLLPAGALPKTSRPISESGTPVNSGAPAAVQVAASGTEAADDCPDCNHRGEEQTLPLPYAASSVKVGELELESRSDQRSEENERWKHQWNHHMRSSLTRRLGTMRSSGMGPQRLQKLQGMLGLRLPDRRRFESSPTESKSNFEKMVDSSMFHLCFGMMIVANAVFIGVQTDCSVKNAAAYLQDPPWFWVCNMVFTVVFTAEVLMRLLAKGLKFFFEADWKWNMFDVFLVVITISEELTQGFSVTYTRLVRGFRMVRVLRVIRVMRFFRELRLMVCTIMQSLVSLSWAVVLLLLVIYIFSICFMQEAAMYLQDGGGVEEVRRELQKWFGSVGTTMFSLLLAVAGGVDWVDCVRPLAQISVFYQLLFAFYVLFVIIGVLNGLTSAFVQRACELSRLDRDLVIQSEMISDEAFFAVMRGIFEEIDVDGTGVITWEKFRQYVQSEDVQAYFATQQIDTTDARELFNLLDVHKSEEVSLEEFIMGCKRLRGQAKSSDMATLLRESKHSGAKHLRAIRKIENQLHMLRYAVQVTTGVDFSHASWVGSPGGMSSYPGSPGSALSGEETTPVHLRSPQRAKTTRR